VEAVNSSMRISSEIRNGFDSTGALRAAGSNTGCSGPAADATGRPLTQYRDSAGIRIAETGDLESEGRRKLTEKNLGEIFGQVMPEDMLKYGLIPEFIGRLPIITHVHNLDEEALVEILTRPRNAVVKQYTKFLEFDHVELQINDDALREIAKEALKRGTGCRALRAIVEEVLLEVMYDIPSTPDVEKCIVTKETVTKQAPPTLVARGEGARSRKKQERSA
jgi:ATP-dependent protease Clp ATPase subunit